MYSRKNQRKFSAVPFKRHRKNGCSNLNCSFIYRCSHYIHITRKFLLESHKKTYEELDMLVVLGLLPVLHQFLGVVCSEPASCALVGMVVEVIGHVVEQLGARDQLGLRGNLGICWIGTNLTSNWRQIIVIQCGGWCWWRRRWHRQQNINYSGLKTKHLRMEKRLGCWIITDRKILVIV